MKHKKLRLLAFLLVLSLLMLMISGCVTVRDMVYGYWQLESYSDPDGSNSTSAPTTLVYNIHKDNTVYLVTGAATLEDEAFLGNLEIDRGEFKVTDVSGEVIYSGAYQLTGSGYMYIWLDSTETMLTLVSVVME